ncbi:MAG: BapA prefix-like domain-containing protein, partial [Pseudomonadales bacterium]|nr:BapA prefix-like domain-containing protein [Pseudomonadales bacterium]
MATNDELMQSRGFPMTPPEENARHDGSVVQVAAGQTVSADSSQSEVFIIHARREDAVNYALQGNDLVVEFADGQKLTIRGFFAGPAGGDQLVFIDGEQPYWVDFSRALNGAGDGIAENQLHWYVPVE